MARQRKNKNTQGQGQAAQGEGADQGAVRAVAPVVAAGSGALVQRQNGRGGAGNVRRIRPDAHEFEAHLRRLHNNHNRRSSLTQKFMTVSAMVVTGGALAFIAMLTYNGYLQTRVNTQFDKEKAVGASGLSIPDRYWGSYRSGTYFGFRARDPNSPVMGLMWYFESHITTGFAGVRHTCEQNENLIYGWKEHDGHAFGVQDIIDHQYNITTSFFKKPGGRRGGEWIAHVNVSARIPEANGQGVSLMFYTGLDEKTPGQVSASDGITSINGYTEELGNFSVNIQRDFGEVDQTSSLTTRIPSLDKIKEITEHSLRAIRDTSGQRRIIVLPGYKLYRTKDNPHPIPNFGVQKIDGKVPFGIRIVYKSGSNVMEQEVQQTGYERDLNIKREAFHKKFDAVFKLKEKGYDSTMQEFAKAAFSNMIGGVSYFYGSSLVQSKHNIAPVPYWKAPLYTAVPSRSHFPRGFLWDEGFHNLLLLAWDREIVLDIMCHWFDLMNIQGWIPREQILGAEALAKVPHEFVIQHNENANPPTFFLTLQHLLQNHKEEIIMTPEHLDSLERLYPRLKMWFTWFNSSQVGLLPTTYRWRGRDANIERFLNPKTLTSGLDDYPRASHPTDEERHVDLRCWMALAAEVLAEISELLGHDGDKYRNTYFMLKDNDLLDKLHWSKDRARYSDFGLHTDAVTLMKPTGPPQPGNPNNDMVRVVLTEPEYRYIDKQFGYINLFPFFLQILEPSHENLEKVLNDIKDPSLLWTNQGLRSLSPNSPMYMTRNTEHDPPYWRGQIWINMNYLACRALHHYANISGPYQNLAGEIYAQLRKNIVNTLFKEYQRTGFLWENYDDKKGEGKGAHPFNGWSSLVTLIMAEIY